MSENVSIKKAAFINGIGKYLTVILQILVNAILSRILTPEDYGIVVMITVFSTFFVSLSDMGFGVAIVQKKELISNDIDRIFTFTIYIAFLLMLSFCGFSFIIADFYNNRIFIELGCLLSIALFFYTANMVPNGLMNRAKRFKSIAIRTIVIYGISAAIAVSMALYGFRYYSLIVQNITSAVGIFFWNYYSSSLKLSNNNILDSVKKVFNYSSFQFAFNLVNYFSRNLDSLLIGKFLGDGLLGYYYKAYNLMLYPINNITGVINPVLHPILSDYQKQKNIIYEKYVGLVKILFIIGSFVAPACYFLSDELVTAFYGDNWEVTKKCFMWLSFAVLPQLVGSTAGSVYQALGTTKLLFYNAVFNTTITIVAILIGVFYMQDIVLLSMLVSMSYVIHFFSVYFFLIRYAFKLSFIMFLCNIKNEVLILLFMYLYVFFYPVNTNGLVFGIIAKIIYLFGGYILILMLTRKYKLLIYLFRK